MDYGKFQFELSKRKAAQRKKQKQVHIKEVKFRPVTEMNDYQFKLKKIIQFLKHGDKVKITVRFRGREFVHKDIGLDLLTRVEKDLVEIAIIEQASKFEGHQAVMIVGSKKKK